MPVLTKFCGIAMRMLVDPTFGTHFHAFHGDAELVIGINPVRVIQGDAPEWVRVLALDWVARHQSQGLAEPRLDRHSPTPAPG